MSRISTVPGEEFSIEMCPERPLFLIPVRVAATESKTRWMTQVLYRPQTVSFTTHRLCHSERSEES